MPDETRSSSAIFGALPTRGLWTPLGLTRGEFLAVLSISIALFVWIDGPVWSHLREPHFRRIVVSYLAIPPLVVVALLRRAAAHPGRIVIASAVLALLKLVATAGLVALLAIARQ